MYRASPISFYKAVSEIKRDRRSPQVSNMPPKRGLNEELVMLAPASKKA